MWSLLALVVGAGFLLAVSRATVFEAANGYRAADLGWSAATWVVQVLLPLVLAVSVLLAGQGSPASTALGGGLSAGVTLNLVSQLLMSGGVFLDQDTGYRPGPAWWLILLAASLLAVGVAAVVATPSLRKRPHRRRARRAVGGVVLVLAAAVIWALLGDVNPAFGWWTYVQFAGLLLCLACLPVALLDLDPEQRVFGLSAVTTTGAWLVAAGVEGLLTTNEGNQPGALAAAVIATVLAVGGAWVGQWRQRALRATVAG
jgi:hypothetical protein